jgi:predicted CXXCH cytochrome family protein
MYVLSCVLLSLITFLLPTNASSLKSSDCVSCHQVESELWKHSDHVKAMAKPDSKTVLGNFEDQNVSYSSQTAFFYIDEGDYKVTLTDDNRTPSETFSIKYTFGHFPLQQYLVETKPGQLQVLPFSWDSRTLENGGQRWYHNYSNKHGESESGIRITPEDRLHWRQPLQNWNGMCADCHSSELRRNYNSTTNTFNTQFNDINVSCVSCHGVMNSRSHGSRSVAEPASLANASVELLGEWILTENSDTAIWKGPPRNNKAMETCYACHSLRAPLTDGFAAEDNFLDKFAPTLVTPPFYFADGQIKEEVFVYGSFLQSKMHAKGVNCLDCHNAHTMKLKIQNNALCLQCHKASKFEAPSHHKHNMFSEGAQCVNCHMPDKTYMGVDKRRDHSFKIPAPHISNEFGTPNACTACHDQKDNTWAATQIESWYGKPEVLSETQRNLLRLRHGQAISLKQHLAIVSDESIDEISRASALELISKNTEQLKFEQLLPHSKSAKDLIRLAATRVSVLLISEQRVALVQPLLNDPLKSIRAAAAQALVGLPIQQPKRVAFRQALNELAIAKENSAYRGEGRVNQGNIALAEGNVITAELAYKASVDIDPYFPVAYVNLADFYRAMNREDLVAQILTKGMTLLPQSSEIAYSFGLHLVRIKNIEQAVRYLEKAMILSPGEVQLAYTYALALDGNDQTDLAIQRLKMLIGEYTDNSSLIELGLFLSHKTNKRAQFEWFSKLNTSTHSD